MTAARAQDDFRAGRANVRGVENLVGVARLQHAILMDPGGVREGVGADDGLVCLHVHTGDAAYEVARPRELLRDDAGVRVELVAVHLDGHDDLFEGGVAGALAKAVYRALDLRCTVLYARERQRRRHAEVVVGVYADGHVLDAAHVVREALDSRTEVVRQLVSRRVGNVHDGGTGVYGRLYHALQELLVRAARVLGVELDVVHVLLRILDAVNRALDALVLANAQLLAQMLGRNAQTGVNAGALSGLQGFGSAVNVLVHRSRESDDHGIVTRQAPNLLNRAEVAGRRNGEPGLDYVHVHPEQLLGNNELLLGVHRCARRLLAVSQCGVEDVDLAGHERLLSDGVARQ